MTRIGIPIPFGGVSSEEALAKQKPGTTRRALNVRGYDARTRRKRLSQRAGQRRYAPTTVNGASKVSALIPVSYDARNQTYSSETTGAEPTTLSKPAPSLREVPIVRQDALGNKYFIDGRSTVVKMNTDGVVVWKLVLPVKKAQATVRALWVDDDLMVYAATSAGLFEDKCKIWKYRQLNDDKTELVWEYDTDAFVEDLQIREGKMAAILNRASDSTASLVLYDGLFFNEPVERWRRKIAYPSNCVSISLKDGSIFVASEANSLRGVIATDPLLSATSEHWTPDQLPQFASRAWSWHKADDIDGDGTNNSAYTDGDVVSTWYDQTNNGRHWFAHTSAAAVGGRLQARGCAGRDAIKMTDGTGGSPKCGYASGTGATEERSGAAQQANMLPGYTGQGFVAFWVVRCAASTTMRPLIVQNTTGGGAYAAGDLALLLNTAPGAGHAFAAAAGGVTWNDDNARVGAVLVQPQEQYWNRELPDPLVASDTMLITLIYDGTPYGALAAPNNCELRVNGRVAQRFHADAARAWSEATELGCALNAPAGTTPFSGGLCEMLVLCDYQPVPGGAWSLIENGWTSGTTAGTELQLCEGYFAHRWGIAHTLPIGAVGAVQFAGGVPAANLDTVTIDGKVYTFKTAIAVTDGDVLRGATDIVSYTNLGHAINLTGTPGTDYGINTTRHPTVTAVECYYPTIANPGLLLIGRDPADTAFTVTDTGANISSTAGIVGFSSGSNTNYAHQIHPFYLRPIASMTIGGPPGEQGSTNTSPEGQLNDIGPQLSKFEPGRGEAKWVVTNPTATNQGLGGIGYGVAVSKTGYVFSMGPQSTTATDGAVTADQLRETHAIFRAVKDLGDSVVTDHTLNSDSTVPWVAHNGSSDSPPTGPWYDPEYHYPRPDVDKYDKCYWPWSSTYTSYGSVLLFARNSGSASFFRQTYPDYQRALGVAGDPTLPEYLPDSPDTFEFFTACTMREANYVLTSDGTQPVSGSTVTVGVVTYTFISPGPPVGTQVQIGATLTITLANLKAAINEEPGSGTKWGAGLSRNTRAGCMASDATTITVRAKTPTAALATATGGVSHLTWGAQSLKDNVIHTKRMVKTTPTAGSPRGFALFAVAGTDVKRATGGNVLDLVSLSGNNTIDAAAQYVSAAVLKGKAYVTDGIRRAPLVVDARSLTAATLLASDGGQVPPRCKLAEAFLDRLVLGRSLVDPTTLYFSERGKPSGWNFRPNVPTPKQAVDLSFKRGAMPDTIQAIKRISDDLMVVGCLGSVHRLSGDPALNGQTHQITDACGVAFGRSITADEKGHVYFASFPEPGVWIMSPGGIDAVSISDTRILNDLSAIDWASSTLQVVWDPQREGLWLFEIPLANPGAQLQRWFWDRKLNAWWPDSDKVATQCPTAAVMLDADSSAHRLLLFGCADGYLRAVDDDARNDDGVAVKSEVLLGPIAPSESMIEVAFDDLQGVLASEQDGVGYEVFATNDPSSLGDAIARGVLPRGRGPYENCRASAAYVGVLLHNYATNERWALEELTIDAWSGSKIRASR